MLPFLFDQIHERPLKVLCLGAHCDDIEIGCGGSLLAILNSHQNTDIRWVVFCSDAVRKREAIRGAELICARANRLNIEVHDYRDGFLPYQGEQVKDQFEELKKEFLPDLVFTHYGLDKHQDHRQISEFTWNTFRDHTIFEYEIPKWDGDFGQPNIFMPISRGDADRKIDILHEVYGTQSQKQWFARDLFVSIMRLRGMECNSQSALAEAFYARKLCVKPQCP